MNCGQEWDMNPLKFIFECSVLSKLFVIDHLIIIFKSIKCTWVCYLTDFQLALFLVIEWIGKANTFVFHFQVWYIKIRVVLTEKKELLFSPCQHQSILSFIGELKECLVKCWRMDFRAYLISVFFFLDYVEKGK